MIILLFGPPGCGKGTQASFITSRYGVPAISTGELFRAECQAGTSLGREVSAILAEGGLVGDDIVCRMVANRTAHADCRYGFLLDGYPRTIPQAEFLHNLLRERELPDPQVIHLEVRSGELVRRLTSRRQCPKCARIYNLASQPPRVAGVCDHDGTALVQRQDDTKAVIRERIKAYKELTGPVIAHYRRTNYSRLDGHRPPEEIHREIERLLAARTQPVQRVTPVRRSWPSSAHVG